MVLSKEKVTEDLVRMVMGWRHSGFNVFGGSRIQPGDEKVFDALEWLVPPSVGFPCSQQG